MQKKELNKILIKYGNVRFKDYWLDYLNDYKYTDKDIDYLLFVVKNANFDEVDDRFFDEVDDLVGLDFRPLHAFRILAKLKSIKFLNFTFDLLIKQFERIDAFWLKFDLSKIIYEVGSGAIEPCIENLQGLKSNLQLDLDLLDGIFGGLVKIAEYDKDDKHTIVKMLINDLNGYSFNCDTYNSYLINALYKLKIDKVNELSKLIIKNSDAHIKELDNEVLNGLFEDQDEINNF